MLRASRTRVDSTMSPCGPDASSQRTPPSGRSERSRIVNCENGKWTGTRAAGGENGPTGPSSGPILHFPFSILAVESFHYSNTVTQIRRKLELLALDRPTE